MLSCIAIPLEAQIRSVWLTEELNWSDLASRLEIPEQTLDELYRDYPERSRSFFMKMGLLRMERAGSTSGRCYGFPLDGAPEEIAEALGIRPFTEWEILGHGF